VACPAELVARWADDRRFFNLYGPTETTIWASFLRCQNDGSSLSIGRPIGNTRLYVLDTNEQRVPVGVPGELCIAGAGVARAYLNRPNLTQERFTPDPYSAIGGRLYKSGDLARFRPDGNIEFLGRIDDQVKLRGFRIELGEVEAALLSHPAVRGAAATVIGSNTADRRLVGYIVPAGDHAPESSQLREFLADQLPDYFIPSTFVTLGELPVTPNGKIDRKSLPAPNPTGSRKTGGQTLPRSDTERAITDIWRRVLATDSIGVHDNFFDIGGHSLLLAEVQVQLEQKFQRKISMIDLMQFPNVASLAAQLNHDAKDLAAVATRIQVRATQQRDAKHRRRIRDKQRLGQ
jgi:acyl carrier protein